MTSFSSSFQPRNAKKVDKETKLMSQIVLLLPDSWCWILPWYRAFKSLNNKMSRSTGKSVSLQHCQSSCKCLQFIESYIVHFHSKQCCYSS